MRLLLGDLDRDRECKREVELDGVGDRASSSRSGPSERCSVFVSAMAVGLLGGWFVVAREQGTLPASRSP